MSSSSTPKRAIISGRSEFDKPLADLFDMGRNRLAAGRRAGTPSLSPPRRDAQSTPNPDSMDLFFQGLARLNKGPTPDSVAQARGFFNRARAADPDNVEALVGSARADVDAVNLSFVPDPTAAFAAAEAKLTKALSSVPDHARGHLWLGIVEIFTKRAAEGIAECKHALELDRNLAGAHATIGFGKACIGRAEETKAHIVEALRFSPRDTRAYTWLSIAGVAKNYLGSWEQAVAWFRRTIEANRNYPLAYFHLAAALAQLDRLAEGAVLGQNGSRPQPIVHHLPRPRAWTAISDDPTRLAQLEPIFEACAGPECPNNDLPPAASQRSSPPTSACASIGMAGPKTAPTAVSTAAVDPTDLAKSRTLTDADLVGYLLCRRDQLTSTAELLAHSLGLDRALGCDGREPPAGH